MRPRLPVLLGCFLFSFLGCGKTEEPAKTLEKTAGTKAKPPETQTASKTPETKPKTKSPTNVAQPVRVAGALPTESAKPVNSPMPVAQNASVSEPAPKPSEPPLPKEFAAFSFIPEEAAALISIRPGIVMNSPLVKVLPDSASRFPKWLDNEAKRAGLSLEDCKRITHALWFPESSHAEASAGIDQTGESEGPAFGAVMILQFSKAIDADRLEAGTQLAFESATHNSVTYRQTDRFAYHLPNPTTMVVTHREDMPKLLDKSARAPLVKMALEKGLDHDLTLVAVRQELPQALKTQALVWDILVPGLAELPDQIEMSYCYLDVKEGLDFQLVVDTSDEAAPKTIHEGLKTLHAWVQENTALFSEDIKKELGEDLANEVLQLVNQASSTATVQAEGKQFKLRLNVPKDGIQAVVPKVVALKQKRAEEEAKKKSLKQLGIALHNFHEAYRMFPFPSGRSDAPQAERGKLSWRVHLLPFIDEGELYKKFKLDEAWDSEHNKALLAQMPDLYKLSQDAKPGHTQIVAPSGMGFVVDGERTLRVADFLDGTSNTIVVLTVTPEQAEPWTRPGGFDLDPKKAAEVLGGDNAGFLALFCDGRVRILDLKIEPATLKALLTRRGKEDIERNYLQGLEP